jgi:hypothetical protein
VGSKAPGVCRRGAEDYEATRSARSQARCTRSSAPSSGWKVAAQDGIPAHEHRIAGDAGEDLDLRADTRDARRPNEDRGEIREPARPVHDRRERVELRAVRVPLHVDVERVEAPLRRAGHRVGEQDRAGAGAEHGVGSFSGLLGRAG